MRVRTLLAKVCPGRLAGGDDQAALLADAHYYAAELSIKARQIAQKTETLKEAK